MTGQKTCRPSTPMPQTPRPPSYSPSVVIVHRRSPCTATRRPRPCGPGADRPPRPDPRAPAGHAPWREHARPPRRRASGGAVPWGYAPYTHRDTHTVAMSAALGQGGSAASETGPRAHAPGALGPVGALRRSCGGRPHTHGDNPGPPRGARSGRGRRRAPVLRRLVPPAR
jgi:hypothetical protein